MPRDVEGAVVVVTGASSGIGRATARAFAREGATVVMAARREQALEEAAEEIRKGGGKAAAVVADVADERAVEELAAGAVRDFGRIDVWVNNAGVYLLGKFDETPAAEHRRVIETNLFGTFHGSIAALRRFREQGRGVLVNVSSMTARVPQPYAGAYVASKHAIRGLGMVLRQELALEGADGIHVCTVMPASIDTPLFRHAANYTGRAVQAMKPVYPAEAVAETIVSLALRPRREVFVGNAARLLSMPHALAPGLVDRITATLTSRVQLAGEAVPPTPGNLFQPMPEGTAVGGGWGATGRPSYTVRRALGVGLLAASGLLLLSALRSGSGRGTRRAA